MNEWLQDIRWYEVAILSLQVALLVLNVVFAVMYGRLISIVAVALIAVMTAATFALQRNTVSIRRDTRERYGVRI